MKSIGVSFTSRSFAELDRSIDRRLGGGGIGAGANLGRVEADLGDCVGKGGVGGLRRETVLRCENGIGKFEEGIIAAQLCDAHAVGGSLVGFAVERGQREVFKDEVRLREVGEKVLNDRLHSLAVRALEVGELDEGEFLVCGSAAGALGALVEDASRVGVRMGAEGQDIVGDEVIAVRRGVEDQRADLLLRIALLCDEDGDLTDIRRGRGLDGGYLPDAVGVVSPGDVQEGFDGFTGGSSGGEVIGIDRRELRPGRSSGG